MEKIFKDTTEGNQCTSVFIRGKEVVPAGTLIYSMSEKDNNDQYKRFANDYDIHFIFDNNIPKIDFYTIPYVSIMAVDSMGGYIGTIEYYDYNIKDSPPICYIDKNKKCFFVANNFNAFIENISNWKERLIPYNHMEFFSSLDAAKEKYDFVDL